jgi:hypothetical protein
LTYFDILGFGLPAARYCNFKHFISAALVTAMCGARGLSCCRWHRPAFPLLAIPSARGSSSTGLADAWPVIFRRHPGDSTYPWLAGEIVWGHAAEVIHVIDPVEGGQLRGVSQLAPAIVKLFLLDQYDDAGLNRKKIAAMFVTSPAPENHLRSGPIVGLEVVVAAFFNLPNLRG